MRFRPCVLLRSSGPMYEEQLGRYEEAWGAMVGFE